MGLIFCLKVKWPGVTALVEVAQKSALRGTNLTILQIMASREALRPACADDWRGHAARSPTTWRRIRPKAMQQRQEHASTAKVRLGLHVVEKRLPRSRATGRSGAPESYPAASAVSY